MALAAIRPPSLLGRAVAGGITLRDRAHSLAALPIRAADVATLDAVGRANRTCTFLIAESGTTIAVSVTVVACGLAVKPAPLVDVGARAAIAFSAAALSILIALFGVGKAGIGRAETIDTAQGAALGAGAAGSFLLRADAQDLHASVRERVALTGTTVFADEAILPSRAAGALTRSFITVA